MESESLPAPALSVAAQDPVAANEPDPASATIPGGRFGNGRALGSLEPYRGVLPGSG
jgi:hypothetical protein